jgi:hypothetical protein
MSTCGEGEIQIRQQLQVLKKQLVLPPVKTAKSRRTVMVPDVWLKALRTHRTTQREERLKAGWRWVDTGLVFTTYRTYKEEKGENLKGGRRPAPPKTAARPTRTSGRCRAEDCAPAFSRSQALRGVAPHRERRRTRAGESAARSLELRVTADLYAHPATADVREGRARNGRDPGALGSDWRSNVTGKQCGRCLTGDFSSVLPER